MRFEAEIRRFARNAYGSAVKALRLTQFESVAVAQVEPSGFELTRAGRRTYLGYSAAVTGIAPVQALPTTAAQWVIWNAEEPGGLSYGLETIGMYCTSGTPGVGGILLGCLFKAPAQVGNSNTGIALSYGGSVGSSASKAKVKSGVTITDPAAPVWTQLAENLSPNVGAFPGSGVFVNRGLGGRLAIPPQCGLGLAVVAPAGTTPLFAPFGDWGELDAEME